MENLYKACDLCPNSCLVDRTKRLGLCGQSDEVKIGWAGLHKGEEPPLIGELGAGMIFFSGCPIACQYCQNHQISCRGDKSLGVKVSVEELKNIILELQRVGATCLNLVTATHFVPSIIKALDLAKKEGFNLPVVYNTSGFESVYGLSLIDPYIDLYLVDFKSLDAKVSKDYCSTSKYKDVIIPCLDFITKQKPYTDLDKIYGSIVRHLVFPNSLDASIDVLEYYAKHYKDKCFLSLMVQFVSPREGEYFPPLTEDEYDSLLSYLDIYDIEEGFVQELGDDEVWIPNFNNPNPFPDGFATPLEYFLSLKK